MATSKYFGAIEIPDFGLTAFQERIYRTRETENGLHYADLSGSSIPVDMYTTERTLKINLPNIYRGLEDHVNEGVSSGSGTSDNPIRQELRTCGGLFLDYLMRTFAFEGYTPTEVVDGLRRDFLENPTRNKLAFIVLEEAIMGKSSGSEPVYTGNDGNNYSLQKLIDSLEGNGYGAIFLCCETLGYKLKVADAPIVFLGGNPDDATRSITLALVPADKLDATTIKIREIEMT